MAFAAPGPNDIVRRHADSCAVCAAEVQHWRDVATLLQLAEKNEPAPGPCLDEMTIAAVASGKWAALSPSSKAHVVDCAACRAQLAGAIEALNAPEIAAEIDRIQSTSKPAGARRMPAWTVAALAAAVAGLVIVPQLFLTRDNAAPNRTRELRDADPTITKTVAPRIVAPVGTVGRVTALTWTGVPGATRYGVRLFGSDGTVVWEAETNDTTIALPRTIELTPGIVYLYQVEAYVGFDRSAESELVEFRVRQ